MNHVVKIAWVCTLSTLSAFCLALPEDRNQAIQIQAMSAERDAQTGVTTYTGDVEVVQGSLHIHAESVVLHTDRNNKLTEVTATGKPARFQQQLSGPNDTVKSQANKIVYNVAKDLITLRGNGKIDQPSGSIAGETIDYDLKTERVRARAAEAGASNNNRRITVIIPPKTNSTPAAAAKKESSP